MWGAGSVDARFEKARKSFKHFLKSTNNSCLPTKFLCVGSPCKISPVRLLSKGKWTQSNGTTKVNQVKKDAVLLAMKQTSFEPNVFAQGLARGSSKTIGVLTQNNGNPIHNAISQGVLKSLTPSTYSAIFA